MVLFLQVYKILVWTTLLLCVWKSHIWGLLVCHEWLWGIRANAVAWDPSYNNTDSFKGPTKTAKTTAWALPAVYTSNVKHATGDPCRVYWPTCLACCQDQLSDISRSPDISARLVGTTVWSYKEPSQNKAAMHARIFLVFREAGHPEDIQRETYGETCLLSACLASPSACPYLPFFLSHMFYFLLHSLSSC